MSEKEPPAPPARPRRIPAWALEMLAVFIGITASFWVDDWREERQDTETFHRILGEIYYNVILDDFSLTSAASSNNLALTYASELALQDGPLPPPEELLRKIDAIMVRSDFQVRSGAYDRLINTPLAIPVNDIQLALDNLYGALNYAQQANERLNRNLEELAVTHWWSLGVVPCDVLQQGFGTEPGRVERMGLEQQLAPAEAVIRPDGKCLAEAGNLDAAARAMQSESFRSTLRTTVTIRRAIASNLVSARLFLDFIREHLVDYVPDIGLPVESMHILGSATPAGWETGAAIPLQRSGPNEWVGEVTLAEGSVKFLANGEWTINWGVQPPWMAPREAGSEAFEATNLDRDEVFPRSRGYLNGMNIPVTPGHYRVRFSTQTFEYAFEPLD